MNGAQPAIEITPAFKKALEMMEYTGRHVFLTGKAGTGKSTLLGEFRSRTRKRAVVLAPTGVAALNVRGQTIHSFFQFRPDVTPDSAKTQKLRRGTKALYQEIETIVIDEVSMLRADLLDAIDAFLRRHGPRKGMPFGGVQLVFIGDLYQLPPVVMSREREVFASRYESPYFFSAQVLREIELEFVELEKIYRQHDDGFIRLLNAIRNNRATDDDLAAINTRCLPDYRDDGSGSIHLTTTNELADRINAERLLRIKGRQISFRGHAEGDFPAKDLPTQSDLHLKVGAQVMLLNNDSLGRWINGTIGTLVGVEHDAGADDVLQVKLHGGSVVEVTPFTWEVFRYSFDEDSRAITAHPAGSFTQYPVKLAWAVTIHKSQGKTFDKVVIDMGRGAFAHGQVYVALSRCTTLEGIVLVKPLEKRHVWMDRRVVTFVTGIQYRRAEADNPAEQKRKIIEDAIAARRSIEITYLRATDDKSRRRIEPRFIGEMQFQGKTFLGVRAFCHERGEERTFRLDRILEIGDGTGEKSD